MTAAGAVAGPTYAAAWPRVSGLLRRRLGLDTFDAFLKQLELVPDGEASRIVTLSAPTAFLRSYVATHYAPVIAELFVEVDVAVLGVRIVQRTAMRLRGEASIEPAPPRPAPPARAFAQAVTRLASGAHFGGAALALDLTLDAFVEGASNRVARAAALAVAERTDPPIGLLVLRSAVGAGKTHLAIAAGHVAAGHGPVLYLPADHLSFRFAAVFAQQRELALAAIDGARLVILDDVHILRGPAVDRALEALLSRATPIIATSAEPLADLSLSGRTLSRLGAGVTLEIGPAEAEVRRAIVQRHAARERLDIANDVLKLIVDSVLGGPRDLIAAVKRVATTTRYGGGTVDVDQAAAILSELIGRVERRAPRVEEIQRATALRFSVSKGDMLSSRRTRTIVRPRQVAMYLAKMLTPRSLPEIGRRFGGRDHTTVLHAVRKVEELMAVDRTLADQVATLRAELEEGVHEAA